MSKSKPIVIPLEVRFQSANNLGDRRELSQEVQVRLKALAATDLYSTRRPRGNFIGARFGRLVIQRAVGHGTHGRLLVLCHCDCGGAAIKLVDDLKGGVKSCGCLQESLRPALRQQKQLNRLMSEAIKRLPATAGEGG